MTLTQAMENIGHPVVYRSHAAGRPEEGVIVRVNHQFIFVRYGLEDSSIQATAPENLELIT